MGGGVSPRLPRSLQSVWMSSLHFLFCDHSSQDLSHWLYSVRRCRSKDAGLGCSGQSRETESHSSSPWNFFSTSVLHMSAWKAKISKREEEGSAFLTCTQHTFSPGRAENGGDGRRQRGSGWWRDPGHQLASVGAKARVTLILRSLGELQGHHGKIK